MCLGLAASMTARKEPETAAKNLDSEYRALQRVDPNPDSPIRSRSTRGSEIPREAETRTQITMITSSKPALRSHTTYDSIPGPRKAGLFHDAMLLSNHPSVSQYAFRFRFTLPHDGLVPFLY
jgi:hypothetical protein